MNYVRVSTPGRICLFGEPQDFLGLPVIACAIDLAMEIVGMPWPDSIFHLDMPDIGASEESDGAECLEYRHQRDYLRAAAPEAVQPWPPALATPQLPAMAVEALGLT